MAARQTLGLSQTQVAEKLGITQQTYAGWERRTTALRPDHIAQLAKVLNASVEHLLGQAPAKQRGGGPVGKARRVFEEVSKLPRNRQKHIIRVVEDLLVAQRQRSIDDFSLAVTPSPLRRLPIHRAVSASCPL